MFLLRNDCKVSWGEVFPELVCFVKACLGLGICEPSFERIFPIVLLDVTGCFKPFTIRKLLYYYFCELESAD
jgi:hypothetical protein